jgi:hypothetical protein
MNAASRRLGLAALAALAVAAVVLVAAVLPAEFGRDPLGTGRALGLLALYDADANPPPAAAPAATGAAARPRDYHSDVRELRLGAGQAFEFKYRLDQGQGFVYAWHADGRLKYEFHGEPADRRLKVESYEKGEADFASGTLTAAFAGIHGWYWENPGAGPLTITISSAGFFTTAEEFRSRYDAERHKDRIEQTTYEFPSPKPAK